MSASGYPPEYARLTPVTGEPPLAIPYGDGAEQLAELWLPEGPGPHPVVALVHGGFWRHRFRLDLMHALAADLRGRGLAVWNLEYRRAGSPGGGWPGTFEDAAAGFDALAAVAHDHRLSTGRVVVVGHSAGGHLALWLAARARLTGGPGAAPRLVPALAVALAGVCDLAEAARRGVGEGAAVELMGAPLAARPAAWRHADPMAHLPLGVPQLLVHGTADQRVPFDLSERYWRAARAAGDGCELLRLEGVGHPELIDPRSEAWQLVVPRIMAAAGR